MAALTRSLPASWFREKSIHALERKAVFLPAWTLIGPVTRFAVDKSIEREIAGARITVTENAGDYSVVNGKQQILPVHVTKSGLIFAALTPSAPGFEEYFYGLNELVDKVDFTKLPHRRSLSYEGHFNWKTMVDGYQECLHCTYTHRAFSARYPITSYAVHNHGNFSQHIADPDYPDDGLFMYFFPNCTLNVYGGGMSSFRVCPTENPTVTRMEFDYYHESDGQEFEEYFSFVRRVALEDFELCETAQENLERGIYSQGILNPVKEVGVSHYQQLVRKLVIVKYKEEHTSRLEGNSSLGHEVTTAGKLLPGAILA
ncbi:putative Choline monooxygenase, chloroplastic [Seiridium cardinale]